MLTDRQTEIAAYKRVIARREVVRAAHKRDLLWMVASWIRSHGIDETLSIAEKRARSAFQRRHRRTWREVLSILRPVGT